MSSPSDTGAGSALPSILAHPQTRNVQLLLESRVPAQMAWIDGAGRPQLAAMWFEWRDGELLISTFAGARKLDDLVDGSPLVVSIDTAEFPYRGVKMWGSITVEPFEGLTDSYRRAAHRYLGDVAAAAWCDALADRPQVLFRLRPTRASESDMSSMGFITEPTDLAE